MSFDEAIAAAIRILMEDKGFKTQKAFAEKIGVSEQTVSKYLNGVSSPETKTRVDIAEAAGRSSEEFERLIAMIVIFGDEEGPRHWREGGAPGAAPGSDEATALLRRFGFKTEHYGAEFKAELQRIARLGALRAVVDQLDQTLERRLQAYETKDDD